MWKWLFLGFLLHVSWANAEDKLSVYVWSNSMPASTVKAFEARCHCRVEQSFYGDNEELLAKLAAGAKGYDLIFPSTFVLPALIGPGKLLPLDKNKLPHSNDVLPAFQHIPYDKDNKFHQPFMIGVTLLGYNAEKLKAAGVDPTSWAAVFDPAELKKIKNKVTVLDSSRELFAAALMYLGKDPNSGKQEDLAAASDVIRKAKPYWAAFNNDSYSRQLASGNIWLAMGNSSDLFQARREVIETKRKFHLEFTAQKEGNEWWMDTVTIMRDAPRPDLAHQFIDFLLEGKTAAAQSKASGGISPVRTASPFLDIELRQHPVLNPKPQDFSKWTLLRAYDAKERRMLSRYWTGIKVQ